MVTEYADQIYRPLARHGLSPFAGAEGTDQDDLAA
jgi:hypothetical protein